MLYHEVIQHLTTSYLTVELVSKHARRECVRSELTQQPKNKIQPITQPFLAGTAK